MKIVKKICLGMAMQAVILLIHVFINMLEFNDTGFGDTIQILCSFIAVIFITFLAVCLLKQPIYTILTSQLVTVLYIYIFEHEGFYLLYYLDKGESQWFNSDIFTDTVIIVFEMLVVQLVSAGLAELSVCIFKSIKANIHH